MTKIKKTVIIVGYACNNRCQFCIDSNKRDLLNKTTWQIEQEMTEARQRGTTYLELIGGEMTIRPDLIHLIKFAKVLGFSTIMMATNGRRYAYDDYAKKIVEAGLTDIVFSIHGHQAKLHDHFTQVKGSFNQLVKGFTNMKKLLGLKHIGSNTTIVKQNYKHLPAIGRMIEQMGVANSEFIFVDCNEGGAHDNFYKFVPKISVAAPYIHQCLDIGQKNQLPHWHIRYVPLCYFKDYLNQISELMEVKHFQTEHLAPDFVNWDVEGSRKKIGRVKPKKCQGCQLYNQCEGIWKTYFKYYGDKELKPIKR